MTSSWLWYHLGTIYRPDTKWGPYLISPVLQALLSSNFVRYVRLANYFNKNIIVTVTSFGYHLQTRYEMRTRFNEDMLDWKRNLINDIIMPFGIWIYRPCSTGTIVFKLRQICWSNKGFHQWCHPICQVTLVQFADQVQNDDKS